MTVEITPQNIVTSASFITAVIAIAALLAKSVRWFDRQDRQTVDIKSLEKKHDEDIKGIEEELAILTYGQLASLKGLREQGCNGPVAEAIDKIEKHLNKKAHEV